MGKYTLKRAFWIILESPYKISALLLYLDNGIKICADITNVTHINISEKKKEILLYFMLRIWKLDSVFNSSCLSLALLGMKNKKTLLMAMFSKNPERKEFSF